jgi:hypothetical protein
LNQLAEFKHCDESIYASFYNGFFMCFSQFQNISPKSAVISKSGRVWMDRNLGAQRPAVNSKDFKAFGDLYQWGGPIDGHQIRSSKLQQLKLKSTFP